jgi:tetratricopeptide (TPR) repeat protein
VAAPTPDRAAAKPQAAVSAADRERAVELNRRGEELYNGGSYEAAVVAFEQGYALNPNPTFLYNMALALEKNSDFEAARDALQRYRVADPDAPDGAALDAHIETLNALVEKLHAERAAPEPAPTTESTSEPERADDTGVLAGPLPWVVAGVGAAGLVVGAVLGSVATSRHEDALQEPVHADGSVLQSEAEDLAVGANVAFVAGGVLLATGAALGIIGLSLGGDGGTDVSLMITPAGLALTGHFR